MPFATRLSRLLEVPGRGASSSVRVASGGWHALETATFAAALLLMGVGGAGRTFGWPERVGEAASTPAELPDVVLLEPSSMGAAVAALSEASREAGAVELTADFAPSESLLEIPMEVDEWEVRPLSELPDLPDLPARPARLPEPSPRAAAAEPSGAADRSPTPSASRRAGPSGAAEGGAAGVPQTLRFGVGEGRQPAPAYPSLALRRNQEGTVVVELLVGADGRVRSAHAFQPSPYPLLNEAAVETVRRRWKFPPGTVRSYRVPIIFRIE